jgi:F0F1-type ATP synthase membrane subunit b/b'
MEGLEARDEDVPLEVLKLLSPEYEQEREEPRREWDEICESAERHLAEARRILDRLKR